MLINSANAQTKLMNQVEEQTIFFSSKKKKKRRENYNYLMGIHNHLTTYFNVLVVNKEREMKRIGQIRNITWE